MKTFDLMSKKYDDRIAVLRNKKEEKQFIVYSNLITSFYDSDMFMSTEEECSKWKFVKLLHEKYVKGQCYTCDNPMLIDTSTEDSSDNCEECNDANSKLAAYSAGQEPIYRYKNNVELRDIVKLLDGISYNHDRDSIIENSKIGVVTCMSHMCEFDDHPFNYYIIVPLD